MFTTPEQHAAHPPSTWTVHKAADRCWRLLINPDDVGALDTFRTKREALAAKEPGSRWVRQYEVEGRWFAGETPPGWRSYAECKAERERQEARNAAWREAREAAANTTA